MTAPPPEPRPPLNPRRAALCAAFAAAALACAVIVDVASRLANRTQRPRWMFVSFAAMFGVLFCALLAARVAAAGRLKAPRRGP